MLGRTLGHYQIDSEVGGGGMGLVYKGRDTRLGRDVAIKVLRPEKIADPDRDRRFTREARAASALNHPNIVTIYDIDTAESGVFIAMEFVSGKTLRALIERHDVSLEDALSFALQIAGAMAKAHASGIIHRDLKPENVMVRDDGLVKILDFGLAKLSERVWSTDLTATISQTETHMGHVLGTLYYMSPEQAEGKPVDERSDIFSFGALLYELLTGRRAFEGETSFATLAAVLYKNPDPVSRVARKVPIELDRLVERCLRKDPADRFQSMADIRTELEEIRKGLRSFRRLLSRRHLIWFAAGVCVLLSAAIIWRLRSSSPTHLPPLHVSILTSQPGLERSPTFSPDGSQVAYSWSPDSETQTDIYVQTVRGQSPPLQLTDSPARDGSPAWSPDGRQIAFIRLHPPKPEGDIRIIEPVGGPDRLVTNIHGIVDFGTPPALNWSPDGRWIITHGQAAAGGDYGLLLIDSQSGEIRLLERSPTGPLWGDADPSFAPDGQSIAFVRRRSDYNSDLAVWRVSTAGELIGQPRILASNSTQLMQRPRWSADGRSLYYISGGAQGSTTLWRISVREAVPQQVTLAGEVGNIFDLTITASGRRLAFASYFRDSNIWSMRLDRPFNRPPAPQLIAGSSRFDGNAQISPDGDRLAFVSDRTGFLQIWVSNRDGSRPIQLTNFNQGSSGTPRWSPDGKWIVFDSTADGNPEIYIVPSAGGATRRLTRDPAPDFMPAYSPDGQWIYFGSDRSGTSQIWRAKAADGTGVEQVTRNGGRLGIVSPDSRILYLFKDYLNGPLYAMRLDNKEEAQIVPAVTYRAFFPFGPGVYFIAPGKRTGDSEIFFYNYENHAIRSVVPLGNKPVWLGLSISPDGRLAIYNQHDRTESDLLLVENIL